MRAISLDKVWNFFSSPPNIVLITSSEMRFSVSTDFNKPIFEGMLIDYTIRPVLGILLYWRTEIIQMFFSKNVFANKQVKGSYKKWEHTHQFIKQESGILMKNELIYDLPLNFIGNMAHILFTRKKIETIFDCKKNILNKIF